MTADFDDASITTFVNTNSLPLIVDFNHETAQKIFSGEQKNHLLIFVSYKEQKDQVQFELLCVDLT